MKGWHDMQGKEAVKNPGLSQDRLTELEEKFHRLMELDRNSEEFLQLFDEVDSLLDVCMEGEFRVNVA